MKETEERKMTEEERLLALAVINNGDYHAIQAENKHILFRNAASSDVGRALDKLEKEEYKYTTIASKDYPTAFEKISHPPFVMFYKGNLNLLTNSFDDYLINIVGTKDYDKYIEKTTKQLVKELAKKENCTIMVENKCGVEFAVVETAIKEKGKIVIISNGESVENEVKSSKEYLTLLKENNYSEDDYLIISEYLEPINGAHYDDYKSFLDAILSRQTRTKQIITGVCDKLLIAAATRGDQQQSFKMATIMNKEIFVIPVSKNNKKLINNGLIESGAIAVTSADEIL